MRTPALFAARTAAKARACISRRSGFCSAQRPPTVVAKVWVLAGTESVVTSAVPFAISRAAAAATPNPCSRLSTPARAAFSAPANWEWAATFAPRAWTASTIGRSSSTLNVADGARMPPVSTASFTQSAPASSSAIAAAFSSSAELTWIANGTYVSRRAIHVPAATMSGASGRCRSSSRVRGFRSRGAPTARGVSTPARTSAPAGDRAQRLDLDRAASPEADRDAGDGLDVLGLDDVHEVVAAERRVLRDDPGAERLDLLVDLLDAPRVRLQRLHSGRGHLCEKDIRGHCAPSGPILGASICRRSHAHRPRRSFRK